MSDNINLSDFNNDNNEENIDETQVFSASEEKDEYSLDNGFQINTDAFQDEYDYEYDEEETAKSRKKRVVKLVIWIVSIFVVAIGLAWAVIHFGSDYMGIGSDKKDHIEIVIEEGDSTSEIAAKLEEKGAINSPLFFRLYSKLKGFDGKYQAGSHYVDATAGYGGIAEELMQKRVSKKFARVTIIEGWDVDEIAQALELNGVCTKEDFYDQVRNGDFKQDFIKDIPVQQVYYRLEGYLFPDTYDFYCYEKDGYTSKECAFFAINKMLDNLDQKLDDKTKEQIKNGKYTVHEILTMASIVEMEAGSHKDEMANVAAVFFNRLESKNFTTLGSSPTHHYPYGEGRYDTNDPNNPGIPPGPMCSPSAAAIKACVNPTQNFDYYYFVTDKSMKFYYNRTLAQHNSIVAKLKAQGNWIYEYWD